MVPVVVTESDTVGGDEGMTGDDASGGGDSGKRPRREQVSDVDF